MKITLHSRFASLVVGVLGAAYVVLGLALLGWYLADTWGSAGMLDRAMQFMLIVAVIVGAWFIVIAGGWHQFLRGRGSQSERRVVR